MSYERSESMVTTIATITIPMIGLRTATKEGSCWASPGARAMAHSTRAMEAIVTLNDQRVVEMKRDHWMSVKAGTSPRRSHWRPPMIGRAMNSARNGERMKKRKMSDRRVTHEMPHMLISMMMNTKPNLIANASPSVRSSCVGDDEDGVEGHGGEGGDEVVEGVDPPDEGPKGALHPHDVAAGPEDGHEEEGDEGDDGAGGADRRFDTEGTAAGEEIRQHGQLERINVPADFL
ncbi:uncharacterized protein ACA1_020840 [Acanthamoeba castellanii str. Neff]|uniref:Uncharacterized protein n=1 Tax=Acanthamoeba castellanii (strain ATCC 30010 / Neff) TaxID=1257118 RepID=L8GU11_ACACF|nr:uncharacterized protein ACA1_020840 [Acanthamoeba castellanii str. Neff]ELR16442.1 hypothetical protein ACA1_020840 [Acanthamoeba castellanii str. Neff]